MKGVTSCATTLFWMVKSILLKIAYVDLGDAILLYISLWTHDKRPLILVRDVIERTFPSIPICGRKFSKFGASNK